MKKLKPVQLPPDLHSDLKEIALIEGRTIGRQAELFLRSGVTHFVTANPLRLPPRLKRQALALSK